MTFKYTPGTMYADPHRTSVVPYEATVDTIEGFQLFRQMNPDGTPTDRKCFVHPISGKPMHLAMAPGVRVECRKRQLSAALALAERVARLNPAAGEIGAGMLASLVADAREIHEAATGEAL